MSWQFPPRREDDDLGPPPPPFRIRRRRMEFPSFGNYNRYILIAVALLMLYVVLSTLKGIYVDWLWFEGAGYESVYSKRIWTEAWLFAGGALIFLVYFGANVFFAARPMLRNPVFGASDEEAATVRRVYLLALIAATLFFAVIFGTIAAVEWDTVLRYLNSVEFGIEDPQFKRDLSFYVFELPALRFVYGWSIAVAILTVLVVAGLYLYRFLSYGLEDATARQSRAHLALLLVVVVALFIFRYWLNRFELNFSDNGAVFGATYTDLNARLPFVYVGMALAAITGVALVLAAFGRSIMIPIIAAVAWAAVAIVGGAIYPSSVQRFTVQPNELTKEREYIERNIEMTRFAFGLDQIVEEPFPANDAVTNAEIDANPETTNNIRLLDVDPLLQTYGQIQNIRPLYEFIDVDVDRYIIDGEQRQVMISARELSTDRLPADAQSWVNRRLQFTHGYGVVMSPVNEVVQEGLPRLFLRDIPVTGEIEVSRPEIYYGEEPDHYVIVKTNDQEFDYPIEGGSASTVFEGDGGVHIGSLFKRALFAWEFGDINILISDTLTSESRILYKRNIRDRVEEVAPFLTLDHDPYLVISEGKLFWIQDAYTTTDRIPYSEPQLLQATGVNINYIRNSVKVVIDAYDGSMTFYLVDPGDPIVQTYAKIFPELFTPISEMPEDIREHVRYPEDLFLAQVEKYLLYHITDPVGRYNQEDRWAIPQDLSGPNESERRLEPYYVIMRIPGEPEAEFALIMPLTPARRQNTISWLAARSDGEHYGKLLAFRFPTNSLVFGPRQVETRINQDGAIAAQFGLWRQSGATVTRGNLLMIPIGEGNIFVEPIYLQSGTLPELRRVVVVNGNRIAMEPTLDRALAVVFGGAEPTAPTTADVTPGATVPTPSGATPAPTATPAPVSTPGPPGPTGALSGDAAELARQASEAFDRAQAALQAGDFATYGREIALVEQLIQQLVEVTGQP